MANPIGWGREKRRQHGTLDTGKEFCVREQWAIICNKNGEWCGSQVREHRQGSGSPAKEGENHLVGVRVHV